MGDIAAFERRNEILNTVRQSQRVSTRALSDRFQVSEVTIRQDLQKLEDAGWLSRVHGGAEIGPRLQQELPMAVREAQNLDEKRRIARAAAAFIHSGDTILLDSSTTAFQLTSFLKDFTDLTVVTNNFHVARVLSPESSLDIVLLGGSVRPETWSIVGPIAEEIITGLRVDKGFFGAAGLSLERDLTDADMREVQIKRRMAESCSQVFALVDHSKFGRESFSTTISLSAVDYLITDELPQDFRARLAKLNVEIVVAS